jgi:hypothetical protein
MTLDKSVNIYVILAQLRKKVFLRSVLYKLKSIDNLIKLFLRNLRQFYRKSLKNIITVKTTLV